MRRLLRSGPWPRPANGGRPARNLGSLPPRDCGFPQALRRRLAAVAGRSAPW